MSGGPISLWDDSASEGEPVSDFLADSVVDVAVVGGGFTGLSTALHAAQKGMSVQLLEAERIGYGGSGRNCGLVNAALWLPPAKVREQLGEPYGSRFIQTFGQGPAYVFSLIDEHRIQCEVTRTGTIHAAHSPGGVRDLQERLKEWQRLGEPVEYKSRREVAEMIGTERFHGGLVDHRAGTINPMAYCRGLARAAVEAGACLSTGTRVTSLHKEKGLWRVTSDQGTVRARTVVLGTNAYTDDLWPGLNRVFTIIHYFQLATRPLEARGEPILPGRQGVWDTAPIMFNVRRDAFDRLLIGSMGKIIGTVDRGLSERWARRQIRRLFPALGPVEFESAWHGQIAMTPDHLPRIHALDEGLFTAIGYNGRGITTGTLFGKAMAELLGGMPVSELPLPMSSVQGVSSHRLKSALYQGAFTANQMLHRWF